MKIQENLIRYVLNPVGKLVGRLPEKARRAGFLGGGAALFFLFFLNASSYVFPRYILLFAGGCLALGFMILCSMPASFHCLKLDRLLGVCWFGAGAFMLIAGFLYNSDNFSDAIMFLILYPLTWFVWCQKPFSEVFRLLSKLCIASFEGFLVISVLFFPMRQARYPGLIDNENEAAAYLSLVFACLLVEVLEPQRYGLRYWKNIALIGISATLVFYTNSRTGQLACIVVLLVISFLYLYNNRIQRKTSLLRHILPVVVSIMLFLPVTVYIFQGVHWASNQIVHSITEQKVSSLSSSEEQADGDAIQGEEQVDEDAIHDEKQTAEDVVHGVQGFIETNEGKTSNDGKNLDQISTGRLSIWKEFVRHIRPFGTDEKVSFYIESRNVYYATAHNTPLEYAVHSGAFCGILYFLFNIFAGMSSLRFAVRESKKKYSLLPIAVTMAFGVCSMLGSLKTPFAYVLATYYFFVQAPLMFHAVSEQKQRTDIAA